MIPYKEITDPAFAVKAADTFTIEAFGVGIELLQGPCPRCLAVISIPLFREIIKGDTNEDRLSEDEPTGEPMICTCEEEHAGRPTDRRGCGAYWNFII